MQEARGDDDTNVDRNENDDENGEAGESNRRGRRVEPSKAPSSAFVVEGLRVALSPVDRGGEEWQLVQRYITNTHSSQHAHMGAVTLEEVFRVDREGERARFAPWRDAPNRRLLWHGSRLSNWQRILKLGLKIVPKSLQEQPRSPQEAARPPT